MIGSMAMEDLADRLLGGQLLAFSQLDQLVDGVVLTVRSA
jgi:hypothetical protein